MNETTHVTINDFVAVTKALSDPNRVRALLALRKGESCVCQVIELLGLAPSTTSKHMSILKQAGLVDSRKEGRWVYYRLADGKSGDGLIMGMVELFIAALEGDAQVREDDEHFRRIATVGLEVLCERQRCANDN